MMNFFWQYPPITHLQTFTSTHVVNANLRFAQGKGKHF